MARTAKPIKVSEERMLKILDLPSWDEVLEDSQCYLDQIWSYASVEAQQDYPSISEARADEIAEKAEDDARDEMYRQWKNAIDSAINEALARVDLAFLPGKYKGKRTRHDQFDLYPDANDWRRPAEKIRQVINGVGYFYHPSLQDLLASGPYTPRKAVANLLHWIGEYHDVYGVASPRTIFERAVR